MKLLHLVLVISVLCYFVSAVRFASSSSAASASAATASTTAATSIKTAATTAVTTGVSATAATASKNKLKMGMASAQKLLEELEDFNKKAENFQKGNAVGVSENLLENEAKSLDMKYNELVNIFLEKKTDKSDKK